MWLGEGGKTLNGKDEKKVQTNSIHMWGVSAVIEPVA